MFIILAAFVSGSFIAPPASAYECPKPRPPAAKSFRSPKGSLRLDVSRTKIGTLSRQGAGKKSLTLWKSTLPFSPDVVTFDQDRAWIAIYAHAYGVKIFDPKGRVAADYPFRKFLDERDLRRAGWKCGSWWLVSARHRFVRRGRSFALRLSFGWGRMVRIGLPSGKLTRWTRRPRHP